jgi:2-oxoglutarate dehydrogenase E2 component (dihydrolipoamide succinyltransferase)
MPIEVRVPPLGESVVEATVGRWLKSEGEAVAAGDSLVELETEKVNLEVPAEQSGVVEQIAHHEGDTVRVGDLLGTLAEGAPASRAASPAPEAPRPTPDTRHPTPDSPPAAPAARRLAEEQGVNLADVQGRGRGGRITVEDVRDHLEAGTGDGETGRRGNGEMPVASSPPGPSTLPPPVSPSPPLRSAVPVSESPATAPARTGREERVRLSRRRLTIARRLVEAQHTAAILTTFNEVDMSAVMDVRRRRRDAFRERHGVGLGYMSFFTRAAVGALKAFPQINSELQGEELVLKYYYDIGIAVAAEEGLVVPIVRDADRKSFAEIEREIEDLARRAREKALSLEELMGGTFTITNGGVFGSLLSTPILNAPQVGILGMHKIEERPVALNGQVVIRPMMYLALSYDHRVVDGREAVQFLVRIKELIEDPESLLLEG